MNQPLNKTNQHVNYVNYTNSSAISWNSSTSDQGSLATLIKNNIVALPQSKPIGFGIDPEGGAERRP